MSGLDMRDLVIDFIRYGATAEETAEQVIELVSKHERRKTLVAFTDYCSELGI
jgi:hypothetical protein